MIINSPIDGLVTRRNIEQGETAVMGTMNNAGTVLLTIADMSVLDAEVEVDETDIPTVQLGQQAKITIDAVPDRTFKGHVTEIGNSPIQTHDDADHRPAPGDDLQGDGHARRAGPRRPARLHLHRRNHDRDAEANVVAVPIQALTVREMLFNDKGELVHEPPPTQGASVEPTGLGVERTAAGTHAQGNGRACSSIRDGTRRVHAGQGRHRRREVLRGARRGQSRRPGHHRALRHRSATLADGDAGQAAEQNSRKRDDHALTVVQ